MSQRTRRSLFAQIARPLAVSLLVPFGIATGIAILVGERVIRQQIADGLRADVLMVQSEIEIYLDQRLREVELWSGASHMDEVLTDDRDLIVQNYLLHLQRSFPAQYYELTVVKPSHIALASTRAARIGRPFDLAALNLVPIPQSHAVRGLVTALPDGHRVFPVAHPITSRLRKEPVGMLVAFLEWAPIEHAIARHAQVGEGGRIDRFAVVLNSFDRPIAGAQQFPGAPPGTLSAAVREPGRVFEARIDGLGGYVLAACVPADPAVRLGRGLRFAAFRQQASAYSVLRIFVESVVGAAAIGFALAVGVAFRLTQDAARRLRLLMDGTRRIAAGDFSKRVQVLGDDEFGELAGSFNTMTEEVAAAHAGLEQLVESRTTALRERTEALESNHTRNSAILQSSLDGIITFNAEGRIEEFNPAAERTFKITRQEAVQLFITDVVVPPPPIPDDELFLRHLKQDHDTLMVGKRLETYGRRRDEGQFALELALTRVDVAGERLFTAFVRDITERRRVEQELKRAKAAAEQAARVKSEFLANMSHDIRTPMHGIAGAADLLVGTDLTSEQAEYVGIIKASSDALIGVIDDIPDFSKLEGGKLQLEYVAFDPRAEVEGVADLLALRAQFKGLELSSIIEPNVPSFVFGDPGRVRQILLNLAGSAVRLTREGRIVIRLRARPNALEFEISDTGAAPDGVHDGALRDGAIRDFVLRESAPGDPGPTLGTLKQLIEAIGGEITVRSIDGRGSECVVLLPIETQVPAEREPLPEAGGRTVLVGSADPAVREALRLYLESSGLDVVEAENARAVWQYLGPDAGGGSFAVAVLDSQMPGLDLTAGLSHRDPRSAPPPVVLLTRVTDRQAPTILRPYVDQIVVKPVKRGSLRAAVGAALTGTVTALPVPSPREAKPAIQSDDGIRLLLVEDNKMNQLVALHLLKSAGLPCDVADSGRQALEALADRRYDLILMDCQMPGMSGYEVTERLRRLEHGRRAVVIAMTAATLKEDRDRCRAAGMDDYISKPVTRDALLTVLKRYLPEELFAA